MPKKTLALNKELIKDQTSHNNEATTTLTKFGKRGRKKINQLWKRKKSLIKKSLLLSQICEQQVIMVVHDLKFGRVTHFTSSPDFGLKELIQMN